MVSSRVLLVLVLVPVTGIRTSVYTQ
jgi:hypothetical protein